MHCIVLHMIYNGFCAEANPQPIIMQLSVALASGLAGIISSTLTRVLQCRLEADGEMRDCLYKCVNSLSVRDCRVGTVVDEWTLGVHASVTYAPLICASSGAFASFGLCARIAITLTFKHFFKRSNSHCHSLNAAWCSVCSRFCPHTSAAASVPHLPLAAPSAYQTW